MSEPENFLERWSRRKREAADETVRAPEREADAPLPSAPAQLEKKEADTPEPVDLSDLPSLDSIGADTDVRGFLRPGVPGDMTRAALRRAWSSDPAIRDFVNLVENGHDFNDPDAIPGFGRIAAEDVSRLLGQAIGSDPFAAPTAERPAPPSLPQEEPEVASASGSDTVPVELAAPDESPGPAEEAGSGPDILHRNINVASQDKPRDDA